MATRNPRAHNERSNTSKTVSGGNFRSGSFGADAGKTIHRSLTEISRFQDNGRDPNRLPPQPPLWSNPRPNRIDGRKKR